MTIEAELPDGTVLEFPDGTDPGVVQSAVKKRLGVASAPAPAPAAAPSRTITEARDAADQRFQLLVLISMLGLHFTAAFLLWAMQRVFLGPVNEKYRDLTDIDGRELFCQAPLLFLCVVLGIAPWYLLDWMRPSVQHLVDQLSATGGI